MQLSFLLNPSPTFRRPRDKSGTTRSEVQPYLEEQAELPNTKQPVPKKRRPASEKVYEWRKNLTPEARERRKEADAARKREQRKNFTPEERSAARKKDAIRKAAKRKVLKQERLEKEQKDLMQKDEDPPPSPGGAPALERNRTHSGQRHGKRHY